MIRHVKGVFEFSLEDVIQYKVDGLNGKLFSEDP